MLCFIVTGNQDVCDKYILEFKLKHDILDYYQITYDESMTIKQVRELIRLLAIKVGKNEKRLILIKIVPSIEAQNALLKQIEEMSDDTFLLFCLPAKDLLLPTIISRCSHIALMSTNPKFSLDPLLLERFILASYSGNDGEILNSAQILSDNKSINTLDEVIMGLRETLIKENMKDDSNKHISNKMLYVLKKLITIYPLITKNNINLRLALENTLLN